METASSVKANLMQIIESEASYVQSPFRIATDTVERIVEDFVVLDRSELPPVNVSMEHYYEAEAAGRIPKSSDPDHLEKKALGLLAIAQVRREDLKNEDEELGPTRKAFISAMWPNKIITDSSYHLLDADQKWAIDTAVRLELLNRDLQDQLDQAINNP